jgi:hypothetical protein
MLEYIFSDGNSRLDNLAAFSQLTVTQLASAIVYMAMRSDSGTTYLVQSMFAQSQPFTVAHALVSHPVGPVIPSITQVKLMGNGLPDTPLSFNWCCSAFV